MRPPGSGVSRIAVLEAYVGLNLAVLSVILLWTFFDSAQTGYRTCITTNSYGEFWPEVVLLITFILLGFALFIGALVSIYMEGQS